SFCFTRPLPPRSPPFPYTTLFRSGSVLYMINHGLSTGALFLMIGMIYERYHTRSMKELGGLGSRMPVWATFMVFFTMASVGLPGDRKSTRLNSSHQIISYAVFCLT